MNENALNMVAEELGRSLGVRTSKVKPLLINAIKLLGNCNWATGGLTPDGTIRWMRSMPIPEDHPCSGITIPFSPKSAQARPLRNVIEFVCENSNATSHQAVQTMSLFFEGVAMEVAEGKNVRIPGFGAFGPFAVTNENLGNATVQPRFVAYRPFRMQVRMECPAYLAQNKILQSLRRSHHPSSKPDRVNTTTTRAMRAFRQRLDAKNPPPLKW